MIQNTIIYQNEMEILKKIAHFENFILIILQWITQKRWYIEATMFIFNNKLPKIDH
jgi:hypothetical protein